MNSKLTDTQLALSAIVGFVLKQHDAPVSAESHLHHAIYLLSELCPHWDLSKSSDEFKNIVLDAREEMSKYFPAAHNPWPR